MSDCPNGRKAVSVIYKVVEVANILGFNERTIRRDIVNMSEDVREKSVQRPTNSRAMFITEYGLRWLADKHNIALEFSEFETDLHAEQRTNKMDSSESELVLSLFEQLHQKDLQIAEKDKQIAQLIEQAKNYQVLLQAQQVLSLPAPKRSIFERLFSSSSKKER